MKRAHEVGERSAFSVVTTRSGLPAAVAAVALAVTLGALLTAIGRGPPPPLPAGVYFGWTDGHGGRFQVLGEACPDSPVGADAVVSASLSRGSDLVEFRPPAVADTPAPLAFAAAVPVLSFEPGALAALLGGAADEPTGHDGDLVEMPLSRLTVRCRSHAESSARLGGAAVAFIHPPHSVAAAAGSGTGIGVTSRRVPPAAELLGVLVLGNDADEAITLRSLRIAPRRASTGSVMAAAGDRALVASWLGAVSGARATRPLAGTSDPAALTPWDAAYQNPQDPRALRERSADHLDLRLRPGEMAVIVVGERALARTLLSRPALLYPVLGYAEGTAGSDGAETVWVGLTTPLFGATPAWR